jgi:thiol-disulfide isomerase/thioredoxin
MGLTDLRIFSKLNYNYLLYALLVVVLLVSVYFLSNYLLSKYKKHKKEGIENNTTPPNKTAELMLFFTTWCPHCKTAKPEWEKVKAEYSGKSVNGYSLIFTEIDCTKESPDLEKLIAQYKIEGYPTIKLVKDGQVVEFNAKPTSETLTQFINTAI